MYVIVVCTTSRSESTGRYTLGSKVIVIYKSRIMK